MLPDRLFATLLARPVVAILLLVTAQQVLTFWARDLWWSDEVRQANVLQYLVDHGHWIALRLNDLPYPDKPPLYFWMLGLLAVVTGSTAAPVIFFGLAITVAIYALCTFALARLMGFQLRPALLGAAIMCSGSYFLLLSHYARMDFLFAGLIALSLGFFWRATGPTAPTRWMLLGFVAAALATMTKGPFGFLLPVGALVTHLVWTRQAGRLLAWDVGAGLAILIAVVLAWIGGIALAESIDYVRFIFFGQIVGRTVQNADNPLNYLLYLGLLPVVFLPWTLLFAHRVPTPRDRENFAVTFLWSAVASGLLILSVVGEKHDYYLLPLFAPLAILGARRLLLLDERQRGRFWTGVAICLALIALLFGLVPRFLPYAVSIPGLVLSSVCLVAAALALYLQRHAGIARPMATLLVGQTLWINVFCLMVAPSLNPVLSPRPVAEAVGPYIHSGHAPATFAMTGGDLAYHLGSRYREAFADDAAFTSWVELQDRVVVATPLAAWERLNGDRAGLVERQRVGLAGDTIVIATKDQVPGQ